MGNISKRNDTKGDFLHSFVAFPHKGSGSLAAAGASVYLPV